jgi:hypothetical protein
MRTLIVLLVTVMVAGAGTWRAAAGDAPGAAADAGTVKGSKSNSSERLGAAPDQPGDAAPAAQPGEKVKGSKSNTSERGTSVKSGKSNSSD